MHIVLCLPSLRGKGRGRALVRGLDSVQVREDGHDQDEGVETGGKC